ncbi:unnamed protein product [Ranitomeya imitator]|uniref:BTB domain-containing protein n=1 Tax=Ranitomeya imitator TaxID=111125 RepID=A0ABN9MBY3_9NEOB|nr:unnamed protein product [Ranitomeya imitator]
MIWPPCSPDLNPIENLWSLIKCEIYREGKQSTSRNSVWEAVVAAARNVDRKQIKQLTESMDGRLLSVIIKKDYISVIKMHFGTNLPAGRFGGRTAHAPAILEDGGAQGEDGRDPDWIDWKEWDAAEAGFPTLSTDALGRMDFSSHHIRLLQQLDEQRKKDLFCDCHIMVEGQMFTAHRNVLFASSGYFKMLFSQSSKDVSKTHNHYLRCFLCRHVHCHPRLCVFWQITPFWAECH